MITKYIIRKNTIELTSGINDGYNTPTIIHRNCIAHMSYERSSDTEYRVYFSYNQPIHNEPGFTIYCNDYIPLSNWFDNDDTVEMVKILERHKNTAHYLEPLSRPEIKPIIRMGADGLPERPTELNWGQKSTVSPTRPRIPLDELVKYAEPKERLPMEELVKRVQKSIPITMDGNSLITVDEPDIKISILPTKD